jgi:hypothetical protein
LPEHVSYTRAFFPLVTRIGLALGVLLGACANGETQSALSSVYTDLSGENCTEVSENRETGATTQRCTGVGGWNLLVLYDDQRMSVTMVAPDGKESPLAYWETISPAFTSLGARAEWRVRRSGNQDAPPVALIVRVNASEARAGGPPTVTSYLAVTKINESGACVTRRIGPGANANEQARRAADEAQKAPCLSAR